MLSDADWAVPPRAWACHAQQTLAQGTLLFLLPNCWSCGAVLQLKGAAACCGRAARHGFDITRRRGPCRPPSGGGVSASAQARASRWLLLRVQDTALDAVLAAKGLGEQSWGANKGQTI